uniref:Uncharacterized protein n=1 Tax=Lepeophtheirus salmonis TaxID=72036 RepID=A0A0K2T6E0_LEPSM
MALNHNYTLYFLKALKANSIFFDCCYGPFSVLWLE